MIQHGTILAQLYRLETQDFRCFPLPGTLLDTLWDTPTTAAPDPPRVSPRKIVQGAIRTSDGVFNVGPKAGT